MFGLLLILLSSCTDPCLSLCQQYEIYLQECGYGWSTAFEEQGWKTLDDCYNDNWDATQSQQETCQDTLIEYDDKACY